MVRLTGPLFSEKAQKQLGKNLIYKRKGRRSLLTKYNKPGGVAPFDPSANQINKRMIYNLIIANWQVKSVAQKKVFDDLAKKKNLKMSGWNYFVREAMGDLPTYLGLQGYWAFNRIVDGKYQDISGNEKHGTPKPLYPSNYPQMVDSINKKFGKAGSFDGIDDYVNYPKFDSGPNITVFAWIFGSSWPENVGIIAHMQTMMAVTSSGTVFKWFPNTSIKSESTSYSFALNKFYCVAVTQDASNNYVLYVNGVPIKNGSTIDLGRALTSHYIGSFTPELWPHNGLIDEVRIYNRVLSEEEIKKHYDLVS